MKYFIKSWCDVIINKDILCNNIIDNQIIDIISYLALPIESTCNPSKLVVIFITQNKKEIIHDILYIKYYLERCTNIVEPYTRIQISSTVLQDIRNALKIVIKPTTLTIKNQELYGIKRGHEISKKYLLNKIIINSDDLYVLIYVHKLPTSRNSFLIYNCNNTESITNNDILVKVNEYLNNNELETFDMFIENIKIKIDNNKLYFTIDGNNISPHIYNNLNYLIKHTINEIIIKCKDDISIDDFIYKVKSWTNKRITFTKIRLI